MPRIVTLSQLRDFVKSCDHISGDVTVHLCVGPHDDLYHPAGCLIDEPGADPFVLFTVRTWLRDGLDYQGDLHFDRRAPSDS